MMIDWDKKDMRGPDDRHDGTPDSRPGVGRHTEILRRIATVLGASEDALIAHAAALGDTADPSDAAPDLARIAESADLLRAFSRIGDPEARRRCLAYVQGVADGR